MSDDDFFKWLRSKGINEKDCNTLSGTYYYTNISSTLNVNLKVMKNNFIENGVTASGFSQLDEEDFEDLGLTKIGKKLILKILPESK